MGGVCGRYGGQKVHARFRWENLNERDCLEDLASVGRIVLNLILKQKNGRFWSNLLQDMKRLQALKNFLTFIFSLFMNIIFFLCNT